MNLVKTQTPHIHSREFYQGHPRSFQSAVLSSLQVGNLHGVQRRRRIVTRSVIEGRDTRAKRPAHHGKGMKKKGSDQQQNLKEKKKICDDSNGILTTGSLDLGTCSLAPADFCNVEEELDELDEDDELHFFRALVLDLSYRPINVVNWKRALCLEILEKADVLEYYDQAILATTRTYYIPAVLRVSSFVHAPKSKKVKLTLNRNNIFLRDKFRCQYCNKRGEDLTIDHVLAASRGGGWEWENLMMNIMESEDLSAHSMPARVLLADVRVQFRASMEPCLSDYACAIQGTYTVTACATCNVKKGDKSLEECRMKLLKPPREPKELDSMDLPPNYRTFRILHRNKGTPAQWLDYLPNRPFHI